MSLQSTKISFMWISLKIISLSKNQQLLLKNWTWIKEFMDSISMGILVTLIRKVFWNYRKKISHLCIQLFKKISTAMILLLEEKEYHYNLANTKMFVGFAKDGMNKHSGSLFHNQLRMAKIMCIYISILNNMLPGSSISLILGLGTKRWYHLENTVIFSLGMDNNSLIWGIMVQIPILLNMEIKFMRFIMKCHWHTLMKWITNRLPLQFRKLHVVLENLKK